MWANLKPPKEAMQSIVGNRGLPTGLDSSSDLELGW